MECQLAVVAGECRGQPLAVQLGAVHQLRERRQRGGLGGRDGFLGDLAVELRSALEVEAQSVGRSLHAEILARLENSLQDGRSGLSDELLESIGLQANLTLALAADLGAGDLNAERRRALNALTRVSRRIAERFSE